MQDPMLFYIYWANFALDHDLMEGDIMSLLDPDQESWDISPEDVIELLESVGWSPATFKKNPKQALFDMWSSLI